MKHLSTCAPLTPWIPWIPVSPCTRQMKNKQCLEACKYLINQNFTGVILYEQIDRCNSIYDMNTVMLKVKITSTDPEFYDYI